MNLRTAWMLACAETRRSWGRLSICVLAVALGVFALTLVRSISQSVNHNLSGQAQSSMGADLTLSGRQPLDETDARELTLDLERRGARHANQTHFFSMLARTVGDPPPTQLVRVRAVGSGYPFYGSIETAPAGGFASLGDSPRVILDRQIAERLGVSTGEEVRLGELTVTVAGVFVPRPGSPAAGFSLAPSIYMHERFLPQTQLLKLGSRVRYERLFEVPVGFDVEGWKAARKRQKEGPRRVSVTTAEEASSNVERFVDRLGGFLTLVALMTMLLGAVGIGSSMAAFMRQKLDHAAILRCLGVTPRGLFVVYGLMSAWIATLGSLLGATLGLVAPLALGSAINALGAGFLPEGVSLGLEPTAALLGALLGLGSTLLFTLVPISRTALVSPLRILRRAVEPEGVAVAVRRVLIAVLVFLLLAAGLYSLLADGREGQVGMAFVASVGIASLLLWLLALLLTKSAHLLARLSMSYAIRQGVKNLHRPGNQTTGVIVALGLGVLLISSMLALQSTLQSAIAVDKQRQLPNLFVIDIQSDQVEAVLREIRRFGGTQIDEVPMVAARISAINGRALSKKEQSAQEDVDDERGDRASSDRMRTREYFISYRPHLIDSEEVTEGKFWSGRPKEQEASIDVEIARTLGISVGDVLTLDVQGLPLDARVTSLRRIHWQAVRPNSFILLSPGEIEQAPRQHVASFRIAEDRRSEVQSRLVTLYPSLTVIDVTEAAKTIMLLIDRISVVFRGLGSLAILAGFLILAGAVASGRHARQRESMLLKVVGAKRSTLMKILITEQLVLATLGTVSGWLLAEALSRGLWPIFFEVPVDIPYRVLLPFLSLVVLGCALLGAAVSRRVAQRPALEILRED